MKRLLYLLKVRNWYVLEPTQNTLKVPVKIWVLIIKVSNCFVRKFVVDKESLSQNSKPYLSNHLLCNPSQNASFPWFMIHPMKSVKIF